MKVVLCLALLLVAVSAAPSKRQLCGPVCAIFCPNGNVLDSQGCLTCACNPSAKRQGCGALCLMYCPFGNVIDSNGCPICQCQWPTTTPTAVPV